jgi:hypothetical protein
MVDIPEDDSITNNWHPSVVEIVPGVTLLSTAEESDSNSIVKTSSAPAAKSF